ncbi:transcription-repair coupling factor [Bacteroides sp.]|uniref:transcription-repair coupling factor n=1 Tax=Bacteroides sp. TaxID=29523 RepID=UPI004026844F
MISKSQICIGARIVENDPEEQVPVPYKGKVITIKETGKGEMDYFVRIRLDDESMKQKRISLCCPDKIMVCFPCAIDLEKKQKVEHKIKNGKATGPSKGRKLFSSFTL